MDFGIFAVAFNIGKLFNKQGINAIKALKKLFFVKKPVVFIIFVQKQKFSLTEKYFSVQKLKLAA
jgi:hypothetical protein